MISRETFTKIFLKELGRSCDEANVRLHLHRWWQSKRTKEGGGLRLSFEGYEFLVTELGLKEYEIPFNEKGPVTTSNPDSVVLIKITFFPSNFCDSNIKTEPGFKLETVFLFFLLEGFLKFNFFSILRSVFFLISCPTVLFLI